MKSFMLLLVLTLSSCAIKPKDSLVCIEKDLDRGTCVRIISGEKVRIDEDHKYKGKTWYEMRPAMVMLPPESWVDIKAFIIKICNKSKQCEKEVGSWERSIEHIDQQLEDKGATTDYNRSMP